PGRRAAPPFLGLGLEREDPPLVLAFLFLGGVIPAVLAQVPLFAGRLDLLGDVNASLSGEVVEFGLEPVIRLLGQPGDAVFARLGHGHSSVLRRTTSVRWGWRS